MNIKLNKNIKSVGWGMEDGEIIDDRNGLWVEFVSMFKEGNEVSFEEGLEKVKEYMDMYDGGEMFSEVKSMLMELKEKRNDDGKWVLWNVECDVSLGYWR